MQEYTELRTKNASNAEERFASEFVRKLLKKRLFSSLAAFELTLGKHIASLGGPKAVAAWRRELADYDADYPTPEGKGNVLLQIDKDSAEPRADPAMPADPGDAGSPTAPTGSRGALERNQSRHTPDFGCTRFA